MLQTAPRELVGPGGTRPQSSPLLRNSFSVALMKKKKEIEIASTDPQEDFRGWWMDRCQAQPKTRPQSSAGQINLMPTLIDHRVIIMTGRLEPKAGGCSSAHLWGVMRLWLTVNPPPIPQTPVRQGRRSISARSTHHGDSDCSSDLGLHRDGLHVFFRGGFLETFTINK